jgi:DNA polymerase III epsilon subunit-like protein
MPDLRFENMDALTTTALFNQQGVHNVSASPEIKELVNNIGAPLVILDLETTGLSPKNSEIFEVALVKISLDGSVSFYTQLIDPQMEIPEVVQKLCGGVTRAQLLRDGAQHLDNVAPFVLDAVKGCCLSGFNVRTFDRTMMQGVFKKNGHKDDLELHSILDVRDIWKSTQFTLHGKLGDVCQWYGITQSGEHRACFDVGSTYDILNAMLKVHPATAILSTMYDGNGNKIGGKHSANKTQKEVSDAAGNTVTQSSKKELALEVLNKLLATNVVLTRSVLESSAEDNGLEFKALSFTISNLISDPNTDMATVKRFVNPAAQEQFDSVFNAELFTSAEKSGRPLTSLRDAIAKETGTTLEWEQIHVGLRRHDMAFGQTFGKKKATNERIKP